MKLFSAESWFTSHQNTGESIQIRLLEFFGHYCFWLLLNFSWFFFIFVIFFWIFVWRCWRRRWGRGRTWTTTWFVGSGHFLHFIFFKARKYCLLFRIFATVYINSGRKKPKICNSRRFVSTVIYHHELYKSMIDIQTYLYTTYSGEDASGRAERGGDCLPKKGPVI